MRRLVICIVFCSLVLAAAALEPGQVMYTGGTVHNAKEGSVGRLDTSSESVLVFDSPATRISIPYAKIDSFYYSEELARHLGVLPTIAVGLVKHRQRRHFFRISFQDEHEVSQVAVLEVSKEMPRTLQAVLQVRTPNLCKEKNPCGFNTGTTPAPFKTTTP